MNTKYLAKKRFLLVTLSVISTSLLQAQDHILPLWPSGKIPNYQKSTDVEKSDTTDIIRISNIQNPDIAVYLPAKKSATGQAIIICPGGGYRYLSYNWEGADVAKYFNGKGIAAIVLKYRLPLSKSNVVAHQSPLMDAKRAMQVVRNHAAKWNINKDKVGIMGFSAGGHVAATLGTHFDAGDATSKDSIARQSSRPNFMILVYPVISMSKSIMHTGSRNSLIGEKADSSMAKFYSAELQVTKETPTTFLIHATDDKAVPVENSLLLYTALKDNNVPVEMHLYPKGGHGFGLAIGKGYLDTWPERCIDWLQTLNQ